MTRTVRDTDHIRVTFKVYQVRNHRLVPRIICSTRHLTFLNTAFVLL